MSSRTPGPRIAARRLREQLVALRRGLDLKQSDVTRELGWSPSKVHRIETNEDYRVQTGDVYALLNFYGVPADKQTPIIQLARDSREPFYMVGAEDENLSPAYAEFLQYESFADVIRNYQTKYIPGLLQQGDYAQALVRELRQDPSERSINKIVDLRNMRARTFLDDPNGPEMRFIIDEGALHRAVGGESRAWEERYDALLRVFKNLEACNTMHLKSRKKDNVANPNISIQVVPYEVGIYKLFRGPQIVLDFIKDPNSPYTDPALVFRENPGGSELIADQAEVDRTRDAFDELAAITPPATATSEILSYIAGRIRHRIDNFPTDARTPARDLVLEPAGT